MSDLANHFGGLIVVNARRWWAQAATGAEIVQALMQPHLDITLMDLKLPGSGGMDSLIAIRTKFQGLKFCPQAGCAPPGCQPESQSRHHRAVLRNRRISASTRELFNYPDSGTRQTTNSGSKKNLYLVMFPPLQSPIVRFSKALERRPYIR